MVQRLSGDDARAILADLVASSPEALASVQAELKRQDEEPLDLNEYASKASKIVWSLDGLRPSQVYGRSGEVSEKLEAFIDECKQRLSTVQAFQAIVAIIESVEGNAEGEIRSGLFGCGGIDNHAAEVLSDLVEEMSGEDKEEVDDDVGDLEGVVKALEDWGSGFGLAEVVKEVRGD